MPRKHSSDSDDVPLDSYKARNCPHKPDSLPCQFCDHITTIKHHKDSSESDEGDDVPLNNYNAHSDECDDVPLNSYKAHTNLHKPDSLPCDFCDHISTSIYANFKHNATHIIIPLVNLPLYQCEECLRPYTSIEELTTHAKVKNHSTSQVTLNSDYDVILQSIIKKQLVVKCHDLFDDIKLNSGISQNSTEVSKETKPENVTVSKTMISDNVSVKSELPTYVISDSDSYGRNSPFTETEGQSIKEEQRNTKLEVFQTKPEHRSYNLQKSVTENLSNGNGEQSLPLHTQGRSVPPLHRKWEHSSDSDSDVKGGQSLPLHTEGRSVSPLHRKWEHSSDSDSDVKGGQSLPLHTKGRSVSPLHRKWEHSSDSDSDNDVKGRQSLPLHTEGKSVSPLHRKWEHSSDSDSDIEATVNEDSKMKFHHSDEELTKVDESTFKYSTLDGNSSPNRKSSPDYEPIRSRLVFEDDLEDDLAEEILPDLPCTDLPNMRLLGTTASMNFKPNSIILGSQTNGIKVINKFLGNGDVVNVNNLKISDNGVGETVSEEYPESVPYDTLVKTQICDCRYCGRCFCNRMQLISHEATHLRIRKPRPNLCVYCERFFAGNYKVLRRHVEAKHPEIDPDENRPRTRTCKTCHLSFYNYTRHDKYYHRQMNEKPQDLVFRKHRYKTMKICDLCLNWVKNDHIYKLIGTHSEVGMTQRCYKCKNRHFSVNLVRHFGYHNLHGNRSISNEERLMRIKRKLKMIKKMNKCFCCCFI